MHSQMETVARGPTQHPNPRDHMEAALRNSLGPEDPQHPMAVAKPTLQMRKLRLGGGKPQIQSRDWDQAPPAVWEACFWPLLALVVGVYPGEHPTPAEITSLSWVNTRKQGGQAVGRATFLIVWPAGSGPRQMGTGMGGQPTLVPGRTFSRHRRRTGRP